MSKSRLRVLVLSDFAGDSANVIRDFLYCFNQHSRHKIFYLHAWKRFNFLRLTNFDFNRFDVIVFFWDNYWPGLGDPASPSYIPAAIADRIAQSSALKVQFIQDEYRHVRTVNTAMNRLGINVVFTCVDEKDHEHFYPKALIPTLEGSYTVLTGYVPSYLEKIHFPASVPRPIDIGYRSRAVPYTLGDLGQEKINISGRFLEISHRYGFKANISVREQDRIYGEKWLEFLQSSRFSLGTESGASVVDFSGDLTRQCNAYLMKNPQASYEEVKQRFFADLDGKVVVQAVSPRIFESAAFNNTLILHEGRYSGLLHPDVHYIPVKKDYSNVADIVEKMRDVSYCQRLAQAAHEDIIRSGANSYRRFVKFFDETIELHRSVSVRVGSVHRTPFYAMSYLCMDSILPKEGAFVRLPTCSTAVSRSLNVLIRGQQSWAAVLSILDYLARSPCTLDLFLESIFPIDLKYRLSLIDFAKDLRLLSILIKMEEESSRSKHPFEIQCCWRPSEAMFILRTEPSNDSQGGHDSTDNSLRKQRRLALFGQVAENLPRTLKFNHGAVSAICPWPYHLGEGDVYSFKALLAALHRDPAKSPEVFREILLAQSKPTGSKAKVLARILWESLKYGALRTVSLLGFEPRRSVPQDVNNKVRELV